MGIELGKEFSLGKLSQSRHKRLIAVVAGAKITPIEGAGGCQLSQFFAVAKNAEFSPSAHYIAPTQQTHLPQANR